MNALLAWLLTYFIHSTVLLLIAWALDRALRGRPRAQEQLWRVALAGGLLTASLQAAWGVRPWGGTWAIAAEVTAAPPAEIAAASVADRAAAAYTAAAADTGARSLVEDTAEVASNRSERAIARPQSIKGGIAPVLVGAWALSAAVLLGALWRSWRSLRRRLEGRRRLDAAPIRGVLRSLSSIEPAIAEPRLSAARKVSVPMAMGVVRPEICVPDRVIEELSDETQEVLLAHELGHVARRDPLWRLIAAVIARALFFQPLNWLAARRLAACAEVLADDWAARRTSRPLALASCLTTVARWTAGRAERLPVPAMADEGSDLRRRVERLIQRKGMAGETERPGWMGALAACALSALTLLAPTACGVAEAAGKPPEVPGQAARHAAADEDDDSALADADRDEDDDDDDARCEAARGRKDAGRSARARRAHERRARAAASRRVDRDRDNVDDDDDDDDDDDYDDKDVDIDDDDDDVDDNDVQGYVSPDDNEIGDDAALEAQMDRLRETLRRSLPSKDALEAQIEAALSQAEAHIWNDRELQEQLRNAKDEIREQMRAARKQMRAARKQVRAARKQARQAAEAAKTEAEKKVEKKIKIKRQIKIRKKHKARKHKARKHKARKKDRSRKATAGGGAWVVHVRDMVDHDDIDDLDDLDDVDFDVDFDVDVDDDDGGDDNDRDDE